MKVNKRRGRPFGNLPPAREAEREPLTFRGGAREFLAYRGPECLISGPAGSGKSSALLFKIYAACEYAPNVRCLLVRKTRESLTESGLVTLEQKVLPPRHPSMIKGPQRRLRTNYRFPNGSEIVVGGLDKPSKIMSTEYDIIAIQESTELRQEDWEALSTRLRNNRLPFQQIIGDCNPSSPTHWLYQRHLEGRLKLIPSRHEDNPAYWDEERKEWTLLGKKYLANLASSLSGVALERLLHGRWVQAEGVIYTAWREDKHLIYKADLPGGGEWPPPDWRRFWSVDFGFCVDEETEILTKRGWLSHSELTEQDIALTISPRDGLAEWGPVQGIHRFPAQKRQMFQMDSNSHSSLTTLNHRWLVGDQGGQTSYRFVESRNLKRADEYVPCAARVANLPREKKYQDAMVELVGWFWTEGQIAGSDNVLIWQNQGAKADRIRAALVALFGEPKSSLRSGKKRGVAPAWRDWTRQKSRNCGYFALNAAAGKLLQELAPGRVMSPEFLTSLTQRQLDLLIETSIAGDGFKRRARGGRKSDGVALTQSCRKRASAFQMACQLAGRQTVLRLNHQQQWHVEVFVRSRVYPAALIGIKQSVREYDGMIWCPTTPNGTWLARRRGTVFFTGNTNPFGCGMYAMDGDGRLYLYREIYKTQTLVQDHAARLLALWNEEASWWAEKRKIPLESAHGMVRPEFIVCDHDAEDRATLERHLGLSTLGARKYVRKGIQAVSERLLIAADGRPRLFVVADGLDEVDPLLIEARKPKCLAEEVGQYCWNKEKDAPIKENDHAVDHLRYIVVQIDMGIAGLWETGASVPLAPRSSGPAGTFESIHNGPTRIRFGEGPASNRGNRLFGG